MGFTHENTGKLAQFVQTQETQETFENIIMRKFRPNSQNQIVISGHITGKYFSEARILASTNPQYYEFSTA